MGQSDDLDRLLARFKDPRWAGDGFEQLRLRQDPRSIDPLIADLKDQSEKVRYLAARLLGEMKSSRAVDPLIGALADDELSVRENAALALGKIKDPRAIAPLIAALQDHDAIMKGAAATALGDLRATEATDSLIKLLNGENDWSVRGSAAAALGEIGDPRGAEPLINLLQSRYASARTGTSARTDTNTYAFYDGAREAAVYSLAKIKDTRAVDPLIAALNDSDTSIGRGATVYALGQLQDPRAIRPLIAILKDPKSREQQAAAAALGTIGRLAVIPLMATLKNHDATVRANSAWALGITKDQSAVAPLVKALKDPDSDVRSKALQAIEKINPPKLSKIMLQVASGKVHAYQIVSIKRNRDPSTDFGIRRLPDGHAWTNIPLSKFVRDAHGIIDVFGITMDSQVSGLPDWTRSENYDVVAKVDAKTAKRWESSYFEERWREEQQMMQSILTDRCKLKARQEMKEMPAYDLVIAESGLKIKEAPPDERPMQGMGIGHMTVHSMAIDTIAKAFPFSVGRPIIDKTGLGDKKFDFELKWTDKRPSADEEASSLTAALEEQLGLKLVPATAPLIVLIVEHMERPSPD